MGFYVREKLPACVRYPFPWGRRRQLQVCPRCCPSVPLANTRRQEIRKLVKVVLRAHGLISLIAFFLNDYLSIRLKPGSKRRFPAQPDVSATYVVQRAFSGGTQAYWRQS